MVKCDAGTSVDELCQKYQIGVATLYNCRKAKAEDEDATERRLKELEAENARLRKMYAELSIGYGNSQRRVRDVEKMASPERQKEMLNLFKERYDSSVRYSCRALGLRRQTYYRRKQVFRTEERDKEVIEMLYRVTKRLIAWSWG